MIRLFCVFIYVSSVVHGKVVTMIRLFCVFIYVSSV